MRKIIITISILAACATAYAQDFTTSPYGFMANAMSYGENNYYGTARSMAMGNAMTALGGDLGSIMINPAGSAVSGCSQVLFTGGASISSVIAAYTPSWGGQYDPSGRTTRGKFVCPSVGASLRFDMEGNGGLQNITFSFLTTARNQSLFGLEVAGMQNGTNITSMCGALADAANYDQLPPDLFWDETKYKNRYNGAYDWGEVASFGGNLFAYSDDLGKFIPSTQDEHGKYVSGTSLEQTFVRKIDGARRDFIFNLGFNFEDSFYFGATLGFPTMTYSNSMEMCEISRGADIPIAFDGGNTTAFARALYSTAFTSRLSGIYGKFGVIWVPASNFRIGAAIQTPSGYRIRENYTVYASSTYKNGREYHDSPSTSDYFGYTLRSPWEFNVGLSYVFGQFGMISADYELQDYRSMRYSPLGETASSYFNPANKLISNFCGASHNLRIGGEIRINSYVSARLGYNLVTSAEQYYTRAGEKIYASDFTDQTSLVGASRHYVNANRHVISGGFGYSSPGSFFADLTVRDAIYPLNNFALYNDYDPHISSPDVMYRRHLWDVVLTVGWRF